MRQRNVVGTVYHRPTARQPRDHLPIARPMRCSVVWRPDQKQGTWRVGALPTGPGTTSIAEACDASKARHERAVKPERPLKIADSQEDM